MRRVLPPIPAIHVSHHQVSKIKHFVKWALIHAALVLFFADLLACLWPAFGQMWSGPVQKVGVAIAAFFACVAEYLYDDEELKKHVKEEV